MQAQTNQYNFHKLTVNQGLCGGIIRDIAQDRYGYIWIATVGGLNRFDGYNVQNYFYKAGDSTTPFSSQPRCLHSDTKGRFWIGSETGFMEYDFSKLHFKRSHNLKNQFVIEIADYGSDELLLNTRKGLWRYDVLTQDTFNYSNSASEKHKTLQKASVNNMCRLGNVIYLATTKGLMMLNTITDEISSVKTPQLQNTNIVSLCADSKKQIWIVGNDKIRLAKFEPNSHRVTLFNQYLPKGISNTFPYLEKIIADQQDKLWIISNGDGLLKFDPVTNTTNSYLHNIMFSSSPSTNAYHVLFKDQMGLLWLGCDLDGVNYFNPSQNEFSTLLPFPKQEQESKSKLGRGIAIDQDGNIWMGNQNGLSKYNPLTKEYSIWRNEAGKPQVLYSNMIRSLLCDNHNNIWIGTGGGVNKYNSKTGKIEFISGKNLPLTFYNSINSDKSGNIWFCTNDTASLYWFDQESNKYFNISQHPYLKKYAGYTPASYVLEDSKKRLWISFTRKGLVMFDKASSTITHFKANDLNNDSLIGNIVIDIKEDHQGCVWASTFNGLTCFNLNENKITHYNKKSGLGGNMCSGLVIDKQDRIWIGANGGLTVLDQTRQKFTIFLSHDGLHSVGFPEHAAIINEQQQVVFPTYHGYVLFNANQYQPQTNLFDFYVVSYTIAAKDNFIIPETELNKTIQLKANQNSIGLHLVALNYNNPKETWYGYTLEGFETEWHYTQDPKAVYTNLPGGHYTFIYKAFPKNNGNRVVEKKLNLYIENYFYNTWWFRILLATSLLSIVFAIYKYRTNQREKVYALLEKTQLLEKEKAMAMYENLKQQLNPHFLFNSLTSLNSLIEIEPQKASTFLESLSKTYRYILKSRESEVVSLGDEIQFAQTYVHLQQTRFEKGFEVYFNIPIEYLSYKIAPVTIQNLIENAIKHNIIDEDNPLRINIYTEGELLIVENNLQKKRFVESSNRQGLSQMQSLYQYLSSRPLQIIETSNSFKVMIPLI